MVHARRLAVLLAVLSSACYGRGAGLFFFAAETAVLAAAIVSSTPPPPPQVVYVPEPRPGYAWQPGYWTLQGGQWVWVDGSWVPLQSGYAWEPAHWEHLPDGNWQLVPGRWVTPPPSPGPAAPPPPPPPADSPR
jgi:hypothetical protein